VPFMFIVLAPSANFLVFMLFCINSVKYLTVHKCNVNCLAFFHRKNNMCWFVILCIGFVLLCAALFYYTLVCLILC
jgi:hypothetical protein